MAAMLETLNKLYSSIVRERESYDLSDSLVTCDVIMKDRFFHLQASHLSVTCLTVACEIYS